MAQPTVCYVITHLGMGGAQETIRHLAPGVARDFRVVLVHGYSHPPDLEIQAALKRAGVEVHGLRSLRRSILPFADLIALAQLVVLLRRIRPDVVHTHSSKAGVLGRLAGRLIGVTLVHTVHGWSFRSEMAPWKFQAARGVERVLAPITAAWVVVTARDREEGIANGVGNASRYHVIRSAIDVAAFRSARSLRPREDVRRVGTVARFAPPKDFDTLLEAFAVVAARDPRVELIVVGDGPGLAAFHHQVERRNLRDRVRVLGLQHDVASILTQLDVFVLSSRSEGMPRVVIEALAARVPVVATNVGGLAEVVTHTTGVLVPVGEKAAMAEAITRALNDGARAVLSSEEELSGLLEEFDVEAMVKRSMALYRSLLHL